MDQLFGKHFGGLWRGWIQWSVELTRPHAGPGEFRASRLLQVWKQHQPARELIEGLLNPEGPQESGNPRQDDAALAAYIKKFDNDVSVPATISSGLGATETDATQLVPPPRDEFVILRQTLLENVFLPGEDEVTWNREKTITGIDALAMTEYQRRIDTEAIARAVGINNPQDLQEAHKSGARAAHLVDRLTQLNKEACELYRVVFVGIRLCVR